MIIAAFWFWVSSFGQTDCSLLPRPHFKTPFGCDRLQSPRDCVVGENGSRRTSVRLRALFTSGLAHRLFAQSRFKISFEMSSKNLQSGRYISSLSRMKFLTWSRSTLVCSMVSRSRTVTVLCSSVSPSTVMQKGVPASSWRRYRRPIAPFSS